MTFWFFSWDVSAAFASSASISALTPAGTRFPRRA
jgi:hypothetical protein